MQHIVPNLARVSYLKFDSLDALDDKAISGYMSPDGFKSTEVEFKYMNLNADCMLHTSTLSTFTTNNDSSLNMRNLMEFIKKNKQLARLKFTEYEHIVNIHHLLSEAESAAELTLHGRIIGLTAIYDLPHVVKLDLHIASANELDLFLTFMPVNRTIQKLSIRINHNLSNAAVNGFEQLVNLKDVTLISNGSSLNRIFRCIPFKLITSLEIQHESYEPLDLNGLSDHVPRLQSLRLFAQTVKTLSAINNKVHLGHCSWTSNSASTPKVAT